MKRTRIRKIFILLLLLAVTITANPSAVTASGITAGNPADKTDNSRNISTPESIIDTGNTDVVFSADAIPEDEDLGNAIETETASTEPIISDNTDVESTDSEILDAEITDADITDTEITDSEIVSEEAAANEGNTEVIAVEEAAGDEAVAAAEEIEEAVRATSAKVKWGWVTLKNGHKRYYRNGEYVVGLRKIDNHACYFGRLKGYLKTRCWVKFSKGYSYFNSKGIRVTGEQKIKKYYYYFNKKGICQKGTFKAGNTTYYTSNKSIIQAKKTNGKYYYPNGKAMSKVDAYNFETLQTAKKIAKSITNDNMSMSQKLSKCFAWVMAKPYVNRRRFSNVNGFPAVYANDHFLLGGGNCVADASAFAYLAKAIGYKDVYVCIDSTGSRGRGHGWAMVNGLSYDPLFAQAKSYSRYYATNSYPLHAVIKVAI